MTALSGAVIVITNPLSGYLSDRTTSRFGMRRPWVLGGALVTLVGLLALALADSIPIVAVGMMTTSAGTQAMVAGLTATIVDQFPTAQRVRVAGTFSMCNMAGVVPALLIAQLFKDSPPIQFALVGLLTVTAAAFLCVVLPDRRLDPADRPPTNLRSLASGLLVLPRGARDYRLLWTQRLVVSFGIALISAYSLYYLQSRLGMPAARATSLVGSTFLITTALSALFAYLAGRWVQRTGRGRPFLRWSTAVLAVTLLLKATTASVAVVVLVAIASGAALGVYYAIDLGLVTQVLPDEREAGRYLGAFAMAKQLPTAVAPALAPLLLDLGHDPFAGGPDYFLLFLTCGILTLVGLPLVGRLREVR